MSEHDPVNKPSHYQIMPGVEVYDVRMALMAKIEGASHGAVDDWSRAWEYLTRMWGKNGLEDAKKARWYLDKLIDKLEAEPAATVPMFTEAGQNQPGCEWERQLRGAEVAWLDEDDGAATRIDDESDRQKAVVQDGNTGERHNYSAQTADELEAAARLWKDHEDANPFKRAPDWARYKTQDLCGLWKWWQTRPHADLTLECWVDGKTRGHVHLASSEATNPNWRDTLIERPVGQDPQE